MNLSMETVFDLLNWALEKLKQKIMGISHDAAREIVDEQYYTPPTSPRRRRRRRKELHLHEHHHPRLLFREDMYPRQGVLYSISESRSYKTDLSAFVKDKYLMETNGGGGGWLLVHDLKNTKHVFLLNVYSLHKVQLPKFDLLIDFACLSLSSPSSTSTPGAGFVAVYNIDSSTVGICNVGDNSRFVEGRLADPIASLVSIGGNLYGIMACSILNLVRVVVTKGNARLEPVGEIPRPLSLMCGRNGIKGYQGFLAAESCGRRGGVIVVVKVSRGHVDRPRGPPRPVECFRIFTFDFCTSEWAELDTLGGRTLLLGCHFSLHICRDVPNLRRNCIYFVERGDKNLYVFDTEDKLITTHLPYSGDDIQTNLLCPTWLF
ncbi:unnamed protein product [Cuscuta epithymum]|uniref:KIB1-4 beta-propeller domain-containing protein n=1 Tax=Cuscuta epithymum TaxID=186058 RepID=A0AAV0CX13_9ASTE|nr:unnamed protein product [Cuscuta epithymum]